MPLRTDDIQALQFEDDLTGLSSRRGLLKHFQDRIPWAQPAGPVSAVLIDLDGFKAVNDKFGTDVGDQALIQFAERLRGSFPSGTVLCRYGGDSFLILQHGVDKEGGLASAEKIRSALSEQPLRSPADRTKIPLTLSAAVATFPDDADSADKLIEALDRAIFVSKRSGRNRTSVAGRIDESIAAELDAFSTLPCPAYFGREEEVAKTTGFLEELRQKRPALLFLQGGPGIGKSRFLRHFAERAQQGGFLYLYVTCTEAKRLVPGHALLYLIDRYYEKHADRQEALRAKLNAPQRFLLRELVPAFSAWKAESAEIQSRDRKLITLQAVEAALRTMAEEAPLLILLDNCGFVDKGTLDILRVVIRDRKTSIGVAFALKGDFRSVDPQRDVALIDFVDEFEKAQRLVNLALQPLPPETLKAMIGAILPGAELPPSLTDLLVEGAAGNPLYIEESIRSLFLQKKIVRHHDRWTFSPITREQLPASLDQVILSILKNLPEGTSEILTNAAVIGSQFDVQVLQDMTGQREAQALDAVDKTRAAGLIRKTADGPADDFEFTSGHAREVRYQSTEESTRKRIHRRAADVLNVRHFHQPDRAAQEAAYHASIAEGLDPYASERETPIDAARPARIPEALAPLGPEGLKKAMEFMRGLTGLLKIGRLYPQWSQMAENFKTSLGVALTGLIQESKTATFAATPQELKVNGQALDAAKAGDATGDFKALLLGRLIGSITFQQGLQAREIGSLVAALSQPFTRSTAPANHWDQFLDREKIAHIDVLQRRYIAKEGDTVRMKKGEAIEERPLNAEELELFWTALRYLKAGVDNLRMYPPGHTLVDQAMTSAAEGFEALLQRTRVVTMSVPEDSLLVNTAAVDSPTAADAILFLRDEFKKKEIGSLTLSTGLKADEVHALVSALAVPDPKTGMSILANAEAKHVALNIRNYARMASDAKETMPTGADAAAAAVGAQAPEPKMRLDLRARAWLKTPVDRFLTDLSELELLMMLDALNFGTFTALADQVIDRVGACLSDANPEWRKRACLLIQRSIGDATGEALLLLINRLKDPLQNRLLPETDSGVLYTLGEAVIAWTTAALSNQRLAAVGEMLWKGVKPKIDKEETNRDFKASLTNKLRALVSTKSSNPAMAALKGGPPHLRTAAAQILAIAGPVMVSPLVDIILATESLEIRAAAAHALKLIGGSAQADLTKQVSSKNIPGNVIRVLGVVEMAGPGNVVTPFFSALEHSDPGVQNAAFAMLRRVDRGLALMVLKKTLSMESKPFRISAMTAAAELKLAELAEEVAKISLASDDEELLRSTFTFMGKFPAPESMEALWRVFDRKNKLFGLVKGFGDETRAAAVATAARINSPDALEMIAEAREDKSPVVRTAASYGERQTRIGDSPK